MSYESELAELQDRIFAAAEWDYRDKASRLAIHYGGCHYCDSYAFGELHTVEADSEGDGSEDSGYPARSITYLVCNRCESRMLEAANQLLEEKP